MATRILQIKITPRYTVRELKVQLRGIVKAHPRQLRIITGGRVLGEEEVITPKSRLSVVIYSTHSTAK